MEYLAKKASDRSSQRVQKLADETGKEINSSEIWDIFEQHYLIPLNEYSYIRHSSSTIDNIHSLELDLNMNGELIKINGSGNKFN